MRAKHYILTVLVLLFPVPGMAADDLVSQFAAPSPDFSPVPIWWWSGDRVERDRLRYELERIAAGGIHNAIVLNLAPSGPLYGSAADDPPFLSDQWWELFGYALQEGKRVGLRLWFYDQLGFSGSGLQARVVRDHPEFRGVQLQREVRDVAGPADVEFRVPPGGTALAAFMASMADQAGAAAPRWIWDAGALDRTAQRYFRRTFDLQAAPAAAELAITCDNGYVAYVNGHKVGQESVYGTEGWERAERFDVARYLRAGRNVVAVAGENLGGPGGLLVELALTEGAAEGGKRVQIASDGSFRVSAEAPQGWNSPSFDDSKWPAAHVLGPVGMAPWGAVSGIGGAPGADASLGTRLSGVKRIDGPGADGVLRVSVPQGSHRLQFFCTVPGGFDYHSPAAGAALIDVVHGEMERRFAAELGKGIAGSFQDEFPPMPRFSRRMIDEFRTRCGYDLIDRLPALYDDVTDRFGDPAGPTTIQVRCDANRVAAELCEDAFFKPLHEWHRTHGLLCGYDQTVRNADPIGGESYYVDYFKTMRHYSVPGNDHGGDSKPHVSIADLYERPRVWIEAFHSSGWGQVPEEIATLLHPWLADGATLYNPHAIYYSTHGSFYEWAPPDTGWRQPYFVHYKVLADYVSRLCFALTRGRHIADVALLHPASTVHAFAGFDAPRPAAARASEVYWAVQRSLRSDRLDYIIIDEDSIRRAEVRDGVLSVGNARLRMIILPAARVVAEAAMSRLAEFAAAGGTVVLVAGGPDQPADRDVAADKFAEAVQAVRARAVILDEPGQAASFVIGRLGRDLSQRLPFIHRKVGDRDFYLVLSDDGTTPTFNAQYEINKRRLYDLPAARGGRLAIEVATDGMPEQWDAVSGQVRPIYNYRRGKGHTWVEAELAGTPAPLVAIRPAKPDEPRAIESDLEVTQCRRDGDKTVVLQAIPRLDDTRRTPARHRARVEYADGAFEGTSPAVPIPRFDVAGPFACRLEPTCDNRYGDFAWPPSPGPLPVEVRAFRFREERDGAAPAEWKSPELDDSQWETVIASCGPRAMWTGPLALPEGQKFETVSLPADGPGKVNAAEYSLRLGINEDPIYPTALGGKGRIPEEFIDLGPVKAGGVYHVGTNVTVPAEAVAGGDGRASTLRVGGEARKRVFLNGDEVKFEGDSAARVLRASVKLQPGANKLDILAARAADGRLRLFFQFLPAEGVPPDAQWIWSTAASPTGRTCFSKTIAVPGDVKSAAMVVALGDVHQIRLNGKLVADQGNFDPYFTGRSERYDITRFLQPGENRLEVDARDTGTATGMLLDGLIELKDGGEVPFVSDASFVCAPAGDAAAAGAPARVLAGPVHGYFGETATLLLRPRPHPLPEAGWLLGQKPPPAPFDRFVFAAQSVEPPAAWYRFRVPPGATALALKSPGKVELYVNGQVVATEPGDAGVTALLPDAGSPKRIAAVRIRSAPGFERGAAITEPVVFDVGGGQIPLGSWDELGLPHYSGGLVYSAKATLPDNTGARLVLDLGRVRGVADVKVNGKACGVRLWHPYRFDVTDAAKAGENTVEIRVFNTLGPHFGVGHPSWHVFENQTKSGLFGPISVGIVKPVEMRLDKVREASN